MGDLSYILLNPKTSFCKKPGSSSPGRKMDSRSPRIWSGNHGDERSNKINGNLYS